MPAVSQLTGKVFAAETIRTSNVSATGSFSRLSINDRAYDASPRHDHIMLFRQTALALTRVRGLLAALQKSLDFTPPDALTGQITGRIRGARSLDRQRNHHG
jgi:hypothetical protein